MGSDGDDYYGGERAGRKPSLQARLQGGMNLQICFMNETISDNESPNSDLEIGNDTSHSLHKTDEKSATKRPDSLPVNVSNKFFILSGTAINYLLMTSTLIWIVSDLSF